MSFGVSDPGRTRWPGGGGAFSAVLLHRIDGLHAGVREACRTNRSSSAARELHASAEKRVADLQARGCEDARIYNDQHLGSGIQESSCCLDLLKSWAAAAPGVPRLSERPCCLGDPPRGRWRVRAWRSRCCEQRGDMRYHCCEVTCDQSDRRPSRTEDRLMRCVRRPDKRPRRRTLLPIARNDSARGRFGLRLYGQRYQPRRGRGRSVSTCSSEGRPA